MILLDTSVYIEGFTNRDFGTELRAFHQAALPRMLLSTVVVHELQVGATTPTALKRLKRGLVEPFRIRRRLHVPSASTWTLAAAIDRDLRALGRYAGSLATRSFANDILLAASARELGASVVTLNRVDFDIIKQVVPVRVAAPWPDM